MSEGEGEREREGVRGGEEGQRSERQDCKRKKKSVVLYFEPATDAL